MSKKLPPAKDWKNRELSDWNVLTFHAYLIETHDDVFGVPYFPFGTWAIEQKMLKTAITEYGQTVVKRFIDDCIRTYTPNENYPGISFGFMYKYRNNELQRIIADERRKARDEERRKTQQAEITDDDLDWI